jgi:hypothetical protein
VGVSWSNGTCLLAMLQYDVLFSPFESIIRLLLQTIDA